MWQILLTAQKHGVMPSAQMMKYLLVVFSKPGVDERYAINTLQLMADHTARAVHERRKRSEAHSGQTVTAAGHHAPSAQRDRDMSENISLFPGTSMDLVDNSLAHAFFGPNRNAEVRTSQTNTTAFQRFVELYGAGQENNIVSVLSAYEVLTTTAERSSEGAYFASIVVSVCVSLM